MNPITTARPYHISDAPELLTFASSNDAAYQELIRQFKTHTQQKWEAKLATATGENKEHALDLKTKISTFSESEQARILLMPAFLNQIYRWRRDPIGKKIAFWNDLVDREMAVRENHIFSNLYPAFWTLDGRAYLRSPNKGEPPRRFDAPTFEDRFILDFFSDVNLRLGREDYLSFDSVDEMANYSFDEVESLYDRIMNCIEPMNEGTLDLLRNFIHVIHFRKTKHGLETSSSTNGGHIGRVLIGNAEHFGQELLAEAIVHEAAHGTLFMIDELEPWMPGTSEPASQQHTIPSPWTGNLLNQRNIYQACFIWYGLFRFFEEHVEAYDSEKVLQRLQFIQNGFQKLKTDFYDGRFPETEQAISEATAYVSNRKF